MQNLRVKLLMIGLFMSGITFTSSCRKKGCTDTDADNYDASAKKDDGSCLFSEPTWYTDTLIGSTQWSMLNDTISENVTLTADGNWLISGGTFIPAGITFTILPGTTVTANHTGEVSFLSILQGGMINACGTSAEPIVFTSLSASPGSGDWGGVVINGNAVCNSGTDVNGVGGTGEYGGAENGESSGSICYIRIEYAGREIMSGTAMSGLSLNGCGNGSDFHHIQTYRCSGNGLTVRGGTIQLKNFLSSGAGENSFAWTEGWTGYGQFWVAEQTPEAGGMGISGENNPDDMTLTPLSNPNLTNITLLGVDDGDGENQGILLSGGTKGKISDCVITGFPKRGIQILGDSSISYMTNSTLVLRNSIVDNTYPFKFTSDAGTDTATVLMCNDDSFENQIATDGSLVTFLSGISGVSTLEAFDPVIIGPWFSAAVFIGAVDPSSDWTTGWIKAL